MLAVEAVSGEPVSYTRFACSAGKNREFQPKQWVWGCGRCQKPRKLSVVAVEFPTRSDREICEAEQGISGADRGSKRVCSEQLNISSAELPPQGAQVGNFAIELGAARCLRLLSTHQRTLECSSPVTAMGQKRLWRGHTE